MRNFFDYEELAKSITKYQFEFARKEPFHNVIIDDFVDSRLLKKAIVPIKNPTKYFQWNYNNTFEVKHAFNDMVRMPSLLAMLLRELNSNPFVEYLEKITRIPNLIPDPKLRGGGLHFISKGGKLDVHQDFLAHPDLRLKRKINLILYLNEEWQDSWNGCLELWDKDMTKAVKKISPIFNRAVIFDTERNNHGHADKLKTPDNVFRSSMALYYYVQPSEDEKLEYRSTFYQRRPQDEYNEETEKLRQLRAKGRI